jgi:adhesin/invasin
VQINGAKLTVTSPNGSTLSVGGSANPLTATVTDARGNPVANQVVTFAVTDATVLGLSKVTQTTGSDGKATVTVSGIGAGSASVSATALGNAKSFPFSVTAGNVISFTAPADKSYAYIAAGTTISVSAPSATFVQFFTTQTNAAFSPSTATTPVGGVFSTVYTSTEAGTAQITARDNSGHQISQTLYISPSTADRVLLSASQTTLALANGTTTPSVRIVARAIKTNGAFDQPVAGQSITFSMTGGPGSGEYLTPAIQITDGTGYAYADFYSGTSASIQNGVTVSAAIPGTAIQTGTAPSSNPVKLTIGGQALSVALGSASVIRESGDKTLYIQDYALQVTDANNNPVPNAVVNLRLRPVAFSTGNGTACSYTNTYCSEDANGNGSLDQNEDGMRVLVPAGGPDFCPDGMLVL